MANDPSSNGAENTRPKRWLSYHKRLRDRDIIKLLKSGRLRVDLDTAVVYGAKGRPLCIHPTEAGRAQVKIWSTPFCAWILRYRLVWIAGTLSPIPKGFEIHHRDEDFTNDCFENLICLHKIDHRKIHGKGLIEEDLSDIPF